MSVGTSPEQSQISQAEANKIIEPKTTPIPEAMVDKNKQVEIENIDPKKEKLDLTNQIKGLEEYLEKNSNDESIKKVLGDKKEKLKNIDLQNSQKEVQEKMADLQKDIEAKKVDLENFKNQFEEINKKLGINIKPEAKSEQEKTVEKKETEDKTASKIAETALKNNLGKEINPQDKAVLEQKIDKILKENGPDTKEKIMALILENRNEQESKAVEKKSTIKNIAEWFKKNKSALIKVALGAAIIGSSFATMGTSLAYLGPALFGAGAYFGAEGGIEISGVDKKIANSIVNRMTGEIPQPSTNPEVLEKLKKVLEKAKENGELNPAERNKIIETMMAEQSRYEKAILDRNKAIESWTKRVRTVGALGMAVGAGIVGMPMAISGAGHFASLATGNYLTNIGVGASWHAIGPTMITNMAMVKAQVGLLVGGAGGAAILSNILGRGEKVRFDKNEMLSQQKAIQEKKEKPAENITKNTTPEKVEKSAENKILENKKELNVKGLLKAPELAIIIHNKSAQELADIYSNSQSATEKQLALVRLIADHKDEISTNTDNKIIRTKINEVKSLVPTISDNEIRQKLLAEINKADANLNTSGINNEQNTEDKKEKINSKELFNSLKRTMLVLQPDTARYKEALKKYSTTELRRDWDIVHKLILSDQEKSVRLKNIEDNIDTVKRIIDKYKEFLIKTN